MILPAETNIHSALDTICRNTAHPLNSRGQGKPFPMVQRSAHLILEINQS